MRTGTIFEGSKIGIRQWFIMIYLNTKHKKGVSSYTIADEAEVTQKTCWYRLQAIRWALGKGQPDQMAGIVEADETYHGGKQKNRHVSKKTKGNADKTIVFGAYSRSMKKVRMQVTDGRESEHLQHEVYKILHKNSVLITDDYHGYDGMSGHYQRVILNRSAYEYVRYRVLQKEQDAHNQHIEAAWAWLDRATMGVYHKISGKHLQLYCNEVTFRINSRNMSQQERMTLALSYRYGKISYKEIRDRKPPQAGGKAYRPK